MDEASLCRDIKIRNSRCKANVFGTRVVSYLADETIYKCKNEVCSINHDWNEQHERCLYSVLLEMESFNQGLL